MLGFTNCGLVKLFKLFGDGKSPGGCHSIAIGCKKAGVLGVSSQVEEFAIIGESCVKVVHFSEYLLCWLHELGLSCNSLPSLIILGEGLDHCDEVHGELPVLGRVRERGEDDVGAEMAVEPPWWVLCWLDLLLCRCMLGSCSGGCSCCMCCRCCGEESSLWSAVCQLCCGIVERSSLVNVG